MIMKSFKKCCNSNALNKIEDDLLWKTCADEMDEIEESIDFQEDHSLNNFYVCLIIF